MHNHTPPFNTQEVQEGRDCVIKILQSVRTRPFAQFLDESVVSDRRFALRLDAPGWREMHVVETEDDIDCQTAASHALIYACWRGDLEVIIGLTQNLHCFIDVNALVGDKSAIEWTLHFYREGMWAPHENIRARMDNAVNICRYLIIHFGSKINANRPGGVVLKKCIDYTDVVAYLVTAYGTELIHNVRVALPNENFYDSVFAMLISRRYDTEAELYLRLFHDQLVQDFFKVILATACYGSAYIFEIALAMFGHLLDPDQVDNMFRALCRRCKYDGVKVVLEGWIDQLRAGTIKSCLIRLWADGYQERMIKRVPMGHSHGQERRGSLLTEERMIPRVWQQTRWGLIAQLIVKRYVSQLDSEAVRIALASCCFPLNIELFDMVLDCNMEQIAKDPHLLRHALLECCSLRDIEMFGHILVRCRDLIYSFALEVWAQAGDLEAIRMLFRSGFNEGFIDGAQKGLVSACMQGDAEVTELIIRYAGRSINGSCYHRAFRIVCNNSHEDIIRVLSSHRDCIDFRTISDFGLTLRQIEPGMILLLNSIYDTALDPARGNVGKVTIARPKNFSVEYVTEPKIWYAFAE